MNQGETIVEVSAVPRESTLLFQMRNRETGEPAEAILTRTDSEIVAWRNCCQHQRHVPLDPGDGVVLRDGEILCTRHGAIFTVEDGTCTFGPCVGATLESVAVTVRDGTVALVDDGWTFSELGAGPDDSDRTTATAPGFEP